LGLGIESFVGLSVGVPAMHFSQGIHGRV